VIKVNPNATPADDDRVDEIVDAMLGGLNRLKCSGTEITRSHLLTAFANMYVHHALDVGAPRSQAVNFIDEAYRFQAEIRRRGLS
jgi:hypothetical protein